MVGGVTTPAHPGPPGLLSERDRRRQQQVDDIADWYRAQLPYDELKRAGREVSVLVDQSHRLILVSSYVRQANPFAGAVPPEGNMIYDEGVLAAVKAGLARRDAVVIVDTSDSPGYAPAPGSGQRPLTAKVSVLDIASGDEVGEPMTIVAAQPQLPRALHNRLLSIPKTPGEGEAREFVARHFFYEFLTGCVAAA
jgi:hypothetical protein